MPNSEPAIGPPFLAHLTAREYTEHHYVSEDLFESYFTFSCVRNPWSRVVSTYKYMGYHNTHTFRQFIENILPAKLADDNFYFVRPQLDYISDAEGHIIVDYVAKLESLDRDFDFVRKTLNIDGALPHVNSAKKQKSELGLHPRTIYRYLRYRHLTSRGALPVHKDYIDYYESDLVDTVGNVYQKDVEAFDYSFKM